MILDGVSYSVIHLVGSYYTCGVAPSSQSSSLTCTLGGTYVSCVSPDATLLMIR